MEPSKVFDSYNAGYVQDLYERYLRNPGSVDESWRQLFEQAEAAGGLPAANVDQALGQVAPAPATPTAVTPEPVSRPTDATELRTAIAAAKLVDAYRLHGHLAARVDALGADPVGHPMLEPEYHGVTQEELDMLPAEHLGLSDVASTMGEALDWLRSVYAGPIGYEYEHLEDPERREWLREAIETGAHRRPLGAEDRKRLLQRLSEVEAFEQFLHRAYLGQKRFSGEGTDMLIPMLDLAIERAGHSGVREIVMGMAHRGRLSVLTHVLRQPYGAIISEFEGAHAGFGTTGDVKYHFGAEGTYATESGEPLTVTMAPNPSHLEFVNPVVEGMARAKQTDRRVPVLTRDETSVFAILMHGDAAFAGQGVVPETLNMSRLEGYRIGGTLHIITNNQIGFTTDPGDARSTRYSSDIARAFDIPIFHVNADDPEACLAVVRLALEYRETFGSDVLIDLVGYRRYGHNEGDEPAYTQPLAYDRIPSHPTVRQLWADRLVADGVIDAAEAKAIYDAAYQQLVAAQEEVRERIEREGKSEAPPLISTETVDSDVATAVDPALLASIDRQLHSWPDGFTVHPKLVRQLDRRRQAIPENATLDWAHAEALAFGTLLADGHAVRLTGQDAQRGTFSHRHLVLHDAETGASHSPISRLNEARAPFEVYNSPLSELATMGFEYGYSVAAPDALVLWEGQFGDFVNGAQVIIDQFLSAGRQKWGQDSSLVLLLPHGYEGQGPEHSSARMERFLQLAAENNIRVADCTTPAQYFHLLRRQALTAPEDRRPLIIFTPKSLLRHPRATSRPEELSRGRFEPVLDDAVARERADRVSRVLLCTGKVYYDLIGAEERETADDVAIVRVEELYPFPANELRAVLDGYPGVEEVVWVQEEPENMGAWRYMEPRLRELLGDIRLGYVGRPERASPSEGYLVRHEQQQALIVESAYRAEAALPPHIG